MAKGDLFSTVLRGFHKDQVSQYLNDLIRKYEREKEELNKKYEGISPEAMETLRRENARLRQELEKEKARAAELGAQNGQPTPKAQEDPDLEKLRLLASQIKSRMEEARQMEQAARRESERIIAAARLEGQTILNKAKEASNEGESALGRRRQELDREAAQILKEKSAAQDLLAQAQEDADVLRATARREQEEILENARRQSAEILQKARTEAAEILRQAETEKIRQMEQMRDEMSEAKRQLGSMAGRIGNLSQELERFGVFLAQQNETSANRKEKS